MKILAPSLLYTSA